MTEEYAYKACVRGYHVYRSIWTPFVGELLDCARDTGNRHDPYAVKVVNTSRETVGHLPKGTFVDKGPDGDGNSNLQPSGVRLKYWSIDIFHVFTLSTRYVHVLPHRKSSLT